MKVTFCTFDDPLFTGGPNSWLRRLLPFLQTSGVKVTVLFFIGSNVSSESCPCFRYLSTQGIECEVFPWETTTEEKIYWLLSKLAENPPDIFVPNMIASAFYASKWVKIAAIPTIGILHSDDEFHRGVSRQFIFGDPSYQLSTIVCVSRFLEEQIKLKKEKEEKTNTLVESIPYGVPVPADITKRLEEPLKLLYVGRLVEEQKCISEVTKALCRVVREIPNVEAAIVGDGDARNNVIRILEQEGKDLPIKIIGLVDNSFIQELMMEFHVIVLLSDYEGLPISLMEAMACGLVPVCTRIESGIPELVEHEITGLLVDDRGEDFVSAIKKLKQDRNLWERLSIASRAKIESNYSSTVCNSKWLFLLQELSKKNTVKKRIKFSHWLMLPPVDKDLAREDLRKPSIWIKLIRKSKRLVKAFLNLK